MAKDSAARIELGRSFLMKHENRWIVVISTNTDFEIFWIFLFWYLKFDPFFPVDCCLVTINDKWLYHAKFDCNNNDCNNSNAT